MPRSGSGSEFLQLISEGFVFVDGEFCIVEINQVGLEMARRPRSDFIGTSLWELAPQIRDSGLKQLLTRSMSERVPVSAEHLHNWADGRRSWLEIRGHPADGGLAIFYRDITEQKRSEEDLKRAQAELMHASQLSAMGTMAATLAHELAQPLTSAGNSIAATRKMLRSLPTAQLREPRRALDVAGDSVQRASEILKRLRAFVAKGQVQADVQDLPSIIAEASVLMFADARRDGVEIQFKLDRHAQWVKADAIQVQQVLINLIRNAIEAMADAAERRITISTAAISPQAIEVIIEDTGPGLKPDTTDSVFAPFHSTKKTGLGVGLSISKTIVEAHGGRIEARAQPGGGAAFSFTLPRGSGPD
jgi:two-component system sensor kinase FixL